MKRIIFILLSVILLIGLLGCSNKNVTSEPHSKPYSSKEAISKGDVVYLNKVYNFEKFNQFLTNLANKKVDSIRVTGYTDEGDPLFKDLKFDGEVISYTYDNSNDKFGGSNKGIKTNTCSKVTSEENAQGEIDYTISGCTNNDPEMSYFLLRMKKE